MVLTSLELERECGDPLRGAVELDLVSPGGAERLVEGARVGHRHLVVAQLPVHPTLQHNAMCTTGTDSDATFTLKIDNTDGRYGPNNLREENKTRPREARKATAS